MDEKERAERLERLAVDIDTRLTPLWLMFWASEFGDRVDETDQGLIGSMLRAAYGLGYRDAYRECDEGRPGELAVANGYTKEAGA